MASSFEAVSAGNPREQCDESGLSDDLDNQNSSHQQQHEEAQANISDAANAEEEVLSRSNKKGSHSNTKGSKSTGLNSNATASAAAAAAAASLHGRWTKEEHEKFVEGLEKFGRNWKKVEDYIGSRTGAQIRSHAQKYFSRISKDAAPRKQSTELYSNPLQPSSQAQHQLNQEGKDSSSSNQVEIAGGVDHKGESEEEPRFKRQIKGNTGQAQNQPIKEASTLHATDSTSSRPLNALPFENTQRNVQSTSTRSISAEGMQETNKKPNWSQILNAQEKMRHQLEPKSSTGVNYQPQSDQIKQQPKPTPSHPSKKESKNLQKLSEKEELMRTKRSSKAEEQQQYNFKGNLIKSASPSDFINQDLLSKIFEPADIESHLLEFYMAQTAFQKAIEEEQERMALAEKEELQRSMNEQLIYNNSQINNSNNLQYSSRKYSDQLPSQQQVPEWISSVASSNEPSRNRNRNGQTPINNFSLPINQSVSTANTYNSGASARTSQTPTPNQQDLEAELINQILINLQAQQIQQQQSQLQQQQPQTNQLFDEHQLINLSNSFVELLAQQHQQQQVLQLQQSQVPAQVAQIPNTQLQQETSQLLNKQDIDSSDDDDERNEIDSEQLQHQQLLAAIFCSMIGQNMQQTTLF